MKAMRPWFLRTLEFSLVESVMSPALGLHEGSFGLQSITILRLNTKMESHMETMDNVGGIVADFIRDGS